MHASSKITLMFVTMPAAVAVAIAACDSPPPSGPGPTTTTSTSGGDGGFAGEGGQKVGGGGQTVGGSPGSGGSGGELGIAEQCKQQACAGVPGCDGCEQLCEDWCDAVDGCGPGCGVNYMVDCLAGQSCEAISSLNGLLVDPDIFACLFGVPDNQVCSFSANSAAYCWHCTFTHCEAPLVACAADPQCHDWLYCIETQDCPNNLPENPECYRECDAKFPGAAPLFEPIYACTCANCLESACAAHQDPCAVATP